MIHYFNCFRNLYVFEECYIDAANYLHIIPALFVNNNSTINILPRQSVDIIICQYPISSNSNTIKNLSNLAIYSSFLVNVHPNQYIGFRLINTSQHIAVCIEQNATLDAVFKTLYLNFSPIYIHQNQL